MPSTPPQKLPHLLLKKTVNKNNMEEHMTKLVFEAVEAHATNNNNNSSKKPKPPQAARCPNLCCKKITTRGKPILPTQRRNK
jgi:hypothetical protein